MEFHNISLWYVFFSYQNMRIHITKIQSLEFFHHMNSYKTDLYIALNALFNKLFKFLKKINLSGTEQVKFELSRQLKRHTLPH